MQFRVLNAAELTRAIERYFAVGMTNLQICQFPSDESQLISRMNIMS